MKRLWMILLILATLIPAGPAPAEAVEPGPETVEGPDIVGIWCVVGVERDGVYQPAWSADVGGMGYIAFFEDGTVESYRDLDSRRMPDSSGTYTRDGDKLTIAWDYGTEEYTLTLTDCVLAMDKTEEDTIFYMYPVIGLYTDGNTPMLNRRGEPLLYVIKDPETGNRMRVIAYTDGKTPLVDSHGVQRTVPARDENGNIIRPEEVIARIIGSRKAAPGFVGTWIADGVAFDGENYVSMAVASGTDDDFIYAFAADGTLTAAQVTRAGETVKRVTGTWTAEGSTITAVRDGTGAEETYEYRLEDGVLYLIRNGALYLLRDSITLRLTPWEGE